jgi:hypothetical protein
MSRKHSKSGTDDTQSRVLLYLALAFAGAAALVAIMPSPSHVLF